ncbi:Mu transposase domain-containing protein [Saccharopolyspora erythraea]|uniref:IS1533 transposase n=1 Tax=Saccharopolyspora erythraea (strain ATCC 11635 / DSM 40517 / JCM 4748 / NBRC 13426 / NCIMB 8594 / NRRL 2338) TaxID=405948 RepID=A4FAK0_SACEN|nr:hypothetical protein [Saccharopolyspora erythraea]CAM01075.1 IS1533 transposase [Saccharopolyspora erythraea NRRL 2338]
MTGSNDYSVHPSAIGHRVEITGDLDTVTVTCQGRLVARHDRCWAVHQSITDPDHATAAARLRHQACRASLRPVDTPVEHRELADYDRALGLDTAATAEGQGVA